MRTQLSPAVVTAIIVVVLLLVAGIYWSSTRTTPSASRKPAQAMNGTIPQQPVVPTASDK